MKSNYKRLGDYIRQVDVRNRDLAVERLLGLSVNKQFIPSIANTIGTDMSNYKVVAPSQFVYIADTSRRGDKIAIALLGGQGKAIVSAIYTVFEITNEMELLPEYLMMWFRRPEFDRYARFKSHGSAREIFEWDEMCNVLLPVPPIEEQRKIVAEYLAIEQRIESNRRLIATLEATAKTIYRKMFVDDIDPENLPDGWRMGTIGEICEINTDNISSKDNFLEIQYLDSSSVTRNIFEEYQTLNTHIDEIPSRAKRKVKKGDIVYSTVRPNLRHYGIMKGDVTNVIVSTAFAVIRSHCNSISNELLYVMLTDDNTTEYLQGIAEMSKATYPSVTPEDISLLKVIIPSNSVGISNINRNIKCCFDFLYYKSQENKELSNLQSLLLAKIGL